MSKKLRYAFEVLKISWRANGFLAILSIFSNIYQNTLFPFIQVLLLAQVLDRIHEYSRLSFVDLLPIIIAYIIFAVINNFLTSYVNLQQLPIETKIEAYLDRAIIEKLITLDPATFEKASFQEVFTQIEGTKGLLIAYLDRLIGFINAISKVITASIVLLTLFPLFIPLILVSVIPSYYFGDQVRKMLWPFFTNKKSALSRITQYIKNLLSQDNTSKEATIFKTGGVLKQKVLNQQNKFMHEYGRINNPFIRKVSISNLFQLGVFFYTQYINLRAVLRGTLGIGQFTLAFQQTLNLATGSQAVLDQYSSMMMRTQMLGKYFDFIDYEPSISSPVQPQKLPLRPIPPTIEFKNVSFKYPNTNRHVLKGFNITIHTGEKIALVGENGAGKTTIIKLLLRFYDVTDGEILINGVNIQNLNLSQWHTVVGALFQDFIKYQFTFKENIYYGNLNEKNNEQLLKKAMSRSGADTYLDSLPKGINQIVGKMFHDGIDLSGGQWQKLALARAFFRNAPVLILDEPTSAIDAKAEYEIFENVQKLQRDKTVIIISHRFSTVRHADRILVLEDGQVVEEGSHEKLMKKKGMYAELFEIQAQGYK